MLTFRHEWRWNIKFWWIPNRYPIIKIIKGIRGKPNARRQAMIDKAFLKFDKDGNATITIVDLRGIYNTKAHPKV